MTAVNRAQQNLTKTYVYLFSLVVQLAHVIKATSYFFLLHTSVEHTNFYTQKRSTAGESKDSFI